LHFNVIQENNIYVLYNQSCHGLQAGEVVEVTHLLLSL
jgi:hypothetical protein